MKQKAPFKERHPKLNLLFSFLVLLLLLAICGAILYFLFIGIRIIAGMFIDLLATIKSKLDAVVVVALITGTVSLISVIISSIVSKTIDYKKSRREYLAKKREEPYGQFVEMYYKITNQKREPYSEKEMFDDINRFSKQLTLYGSKPVVRKWVEFRKNGAVPSKGEDNIFVLEKIMNSMRKDLGVKKLKEGELLSLNINDIDKAIQKRKKK